MNRYFPKEDIQMAIRHMKRCSTWLVITERQIKTTMRYHLTSVRKIIIKMATNNKCWRMWLLDSVGQGEDGMIWENGIETCILPYVKWIASPDSMHETGCLGLVHWDDPEGLMDREVGWGFRMGNTCKPWQINVNVQQNQQNIVK